MVLGTAVCWNIAVLGTAVCRNITTASHWWTVGWEGSDGAAAPDSRVGEKVNSLNKNKNMILGSLKILNY